MTCFAKALCLVMVGNARFSASLAWNQCILYDILKLLQAGSKQC
jgi:hypothetical protein